MCTYFIEIAFDGTDFFGWQSQPQQVSVQATIEKALSKLHSNEQLNIVGCGRTDSGVHAKSYIFHVNLPKIKSENQLIYKLNKMLPTSIAVLSIREVDSESHARFDAKWRTYRYHIHISKDPFKSKFSTYLNFSPDIDEMNEAAKYLLGVHDFTTFSKANTEVKSHLCEVKSALWEQVNNTDFYFEITANRFLRNMVRATVGTLLDVGKGRFTIEEFKTILESSDRSKSSASAPSAGLFLWRVEY